MPFVCNYYVTLRCNSRCSFCNIPQTYGARPCPEPSLPQVEANLRDLKRLGVKVIDFTGGEPLLYRDLARALELAKEMGFLTTVTTNGLLYRQRAAELQGNISSLLISLDSSQAAVHDRTRGVECFERVIEAVRVARQYNRVVYLSQVVTNELVSEVDGLVALARKRGVILFLNPCFSYFGNPGLSPENAQRLGHYLGKSGVIVDGAQLKLVLSGGNQVENPVCRAVSSTVVISPDDKLLLPCFHFQRQALPIDGRLFELYRSAEVREARRREGRNEFCQGCTVYCYMRGSLVWRYPLESLRLGAHYLSQRFLHTVAPTPWPATPHEKRVW